MSGPAIDRDKMLNVAQMHLFEDVEQEKIARLLGVNGGRVNEVCVGFKWAINNHMDLYRLARGKLKLVETEPERPPE